MSLLEQRASLQLGSIYGTGTFSYLSSSFAQFKRGGGGEGYMYSYMRLTFPRFHT